MHKKIIFSLVLLLFQSVCIATAQVALSDQTKSKMEKLANAFLTQTKTAGLSIALSKDGKTIYSEGFGYANVETKIQMDPSIRLRTASVAKVITATALGILATDGKLDFDAPIKEYVPYIPKSYAHLTTRQLAGHTAGMRHRPKGERFKKKQYNNIRETVLLMKASLLFEADTDYKYSTHAYNLLGAVIEGASGTSYEEYMNDFVFQPLGMTNTFIEDINTLSSKDTQLYRIKNGELHVDKLTNASYKVPGAGFRSTPIDLVKMMQAYSNGMISKEVTTEMFRSNQLKNGTKTNVGIGWRSSIDPFDHPVIEHAGSWWGARTVLVHYPKENMNISLMINAECPVLIEETAHMFAEVIRNNSIETAPINIVDKKIVVTVNAKKDKETFEGVISINSSLGSLKSNSKGFLKDSPILYLGSAGNYALATAYGLLYVHLENETDLNGAIFTYNNRLDKNPIREMPIATFGIF